MAPRVVFQTDTETEPGKWLAGGALEFSIGGDSGKDSIVLYRHRPGEIFDISSNVIVKILGSNRYQLSKLLGSVNGSPNIAFEIVVEARGEDSSFDGTLNRPGDASNMIKSNWRGSFAAFRDTPLSVIREGKRTIPDNVKDFLGISPFDGSKRDQALADGTKIFQRLMIQSLSDRAHEWFFRDRKSPRSVLRNSSVSDSRDYTSVDKIGKDYSRLLYVSGMHLLCRDLRSADWLEREFRDGCQDKVETYFTTLKTSNAHLGVQYRNAMKRCYYAAYVSYDSRWQEALRNPGKTFGDVERTIRSDAFKEYWLAKFCDFEQPGVIPVQGWLSLLGDKLRFLKMIENYDPHQEETSSAVENILKELMGSATTMGLMRNTMVNPSSQAIVMEPSQAFTEKTRAMLDFSNAIERANGSAQGYDIIEFDVQSRVVHAFLRDEAQELGLYEWKITILFWDKEYKTSWNIEQG